MAAGARPPIATAKRRLLGWALRAVGPLILVLLIGRLDRPAEVMKLALASSLAPLLLALLLNAVPLWLKVLRWQAILRAQGIRYGGKDAWLAFSGSLYLGMLTPGRVGDVLRIQYLRHDTGARYADGLASVVVDRLADLYVLVCFTAFGIAHYGHVLSPALSLAGWLMVAGAALGPVLLLIPGVMEFLLGRLYRKMSRDTEGDGLGVFLGSVRQASRRSAPLVMLLTVAAFVANFAQGYLLASAMGLPISAADVVALSSIQSLAGILPISISGVGVREAFFAAIFPSLGLAPEAGTSYGLMLFLVMYVSQVLIGAVAWQIRPPPISDSPGKPS